MSCDCSCLKDKCRTTIVDSIEDPSIITLANYNSKVKDSFVIDSFGTTVIESGISNNSIAKINDITVPKYRVFSLGINERISESEELVFNTIKIHFNGLTYVSLPNVGNCNIQFGIYKLVQKGTLVVGNPATYDNNSEIIVKSEIFNINEKTKTGFLDIKLEKSVTIKGSDSDNYFLEIVTGNNSVNIDQLILQGVSESLGILGYRYRSEYNGNLPIPDVLAGNINGGGGGTTNPVISEITCPYINLYMDYKLLC